MNPFDKKPFVDSSMKCLNSLHTVIREAAIRAYNKARRLTPANVLPVINEGARSFERQNDLYAQGRTKKGPVVTNSKAGQSFHNYALAIDFYLLIDGKAVWNEKSIYWKIVVDCFKEEGFEWGGDWKTSKDYPHLQKTMGFTWKKLLQLYNAKKFINGTEFVKF